MPPPLSPAVATAIHPLHLYRHLLRETSYLPPAFSSTIRDIISSRFRKDSKTKRSIDEKRKRLSRGRGALRTLRDANRGDTKAMEALMLRGFSRTGASRQDLMPQFLAKQGPENSGELAKIIQKLDEKLPGSELPNRGRERLNQRWMESLDKPKLTKFIKSQSKREKETSASGIDWQTPYMRGTNENAEVKEFNTWGKPISQIVVRKRQSVFWKRQIAKIKPPLPRSKWELLRDLSNGAQDGPEWKIPARRPSAQPTSDAELDTTSEWDWKPYALLPTSRVEPRKHTRRRRYAGQGDPNPYTVARRETETPSSRWFRRSYNRTWAISPVVDQNPKTLENTITWGGRKDGVTPPTKDQMAFMEAPEIPVNPSKGPAKAQ